MSIELINSEEHERILEKIDHLPFGEEHSGIYRANLDELFSKFNGQLKEIFDTIKAYREVSDLINKATTSQTEKICPYQDKKLKR
jgi:hypothetical protein